MARKTSTATAATRIARQRIARRVNPATAACEHCGRLLHPERDLEPEDELICGICEDQRADAQRDAYYEAQGDLERDGDACW